MKIFLEKQLRLTSSSFTDLMNSILAANQANLKSKESEKP